MSFQSDAAPFRTDLTPLKRALRFLFEWLKQRSDSGTAAPVSERLLRDVGLPAAQDEISGRRAMQAYCDRHMPLL